MWRTTLLQPQPWWMLLQLLSLTTNSLACYSTLLLLALVKVRWL
jgi:hypothetical protein